MKNILIFRTDRIGDFIFSRMLIRSIKEANKKKAKVICLPELFLSNYFCQQEKHSNFNLAEKIPGKTTNILCSLAKELKIIMLQNF